MWYPDILNRIAHYSSEITDTTDVSLCKSILYEQNVNGEDPSGNNVIKSIVKSIKLLLKIDFSDINM